ncbi:alpha/beta fold hydrolase [Candidatus Binatia bacterium]|nr:alpha/beta fold hydrolase [Candidatus Binatia bacterium]
MARNESILDNPLGVATRFASGLQNAMEMARLGRLERSSTRTAYDVVHREPTFRLRHYAGAPAKRGHKRPAIILVPPLMISAEVYDISPEGSAVASLLAHDVDPWVVDFGAPERQEGGLRRTLADHVLAVSRAIDHVREELGTDAHLAGYSQGGMFCYETAAYRRCAGIASLITFGSPVDVQRQLIPGIPDEVAATIVRGAGRLVSASFARTSVPAWLSRTVFKLISPAKEIRNQLEFLTGLYDRETVTRREGQRRFLSSEGWVAWPGPALQEFVDQFVVNNRLFSGGFVIEGRTLTLADITCPVLTFVGTRDEIARPAWVRAIREAAPHADVYERTLDAGHFALVVGSKAMRDTWPTVVRWLQWRSGQGKRPASVLPAAAAATRPRATKMEPEPTAVAEVAVGLGRDLVGALGEVLGDGVQTLGTLARNAAYQLPRLARLSGVRRDTRIGMGLTLTEQAAAAPDSTFFLFGGRAMSYAASNRRVDAVVRGLIHIGVRPGEHVGVYMNSRPSALAVTTAINRLGAVAVLLRPDGDLRRELALGEVEHLIADPDHAAHARSVLGHTVYVLGGGAKPRTLAAGLYDMERIDPDTVGVPEWYEPSPGRSEDVAFVLFSGRGEGTRANRITNRRWALSAFGTASAAAMTSGDTVYNWTPIQHPTGLLVAISGALAGGARLALANGFDAASFWEEVRRYGASIVFYAGTMCHALVDAPADPSERTHPVRLFAGSGMPTPIWKRLVERFGPVGVLEFYASTEGNAILANVSGQKVGSVGRPLPGSADVAVADYDPRKCSLVHDASGFCRAVTPGKNGLLLARVDRERGALEAKPLRSVFEKGDAWYATGDLFNADADGDFRLVDHLADVIYHRSGPLPSVPIEEVVWEVDGVSLAAAYGVRLDGAGHEVPVAAVVMRRGARLDPELLHARVERDLGRHARPIVVKVVDHLPMTDGYRILKQPLRAAGITTRDCNDTTWWYDDAGRTYRPLDVKSLDRLKKRAAGTPGKATRRQPGRRKRAGSGG